MKPGTPDLTANRQIHKKAFAMKYRQPSKALNCSQKKIQTPEQSKQVERTLPLLTLLLLQPSPRWALSPFLLPYLYASAHQVSSTTKALAPSPWHLLNILPHPLQPASPVISHPQLNGSQALPAGSNLSRPCPMSPSLSWPPQAGPLLLCLPVQLCFAHSTRSRACSEEPLRKCSPNLLKSHRGPTKQSSHPVNWGEGCCLKEPEELSLVKRKEKYGEGYWGQDVSRRAKDTATL